MAKKKESEKTTFSIDKNKNFSEWFTEIIKTAELADLRYNVKGFLVFQPWSVLCMEAMYDCFESALQRKGHNPYWYPTVIPEKNFYVEKEHVEGFAPEVFWVTERGAGEKLEEKLALRPTSETAFYQMFSLWIRSHRDLPFKTYQRAQVFRHETKATRPFLRGREFYWIEAHCAFPSLEESQKQVLEDMETTKEVMGDIFGVPFIFFERPQWDKFAGAEKTFAADVIAPDGKVIQQPSTHLLGQNFSKAFNVKFTDKNGKEDFAFLTCYGPAISRIFASIAITHGDNKGLRFPFEIAPLQIVIVPIAFDKNKKVLEKARKLKEQLRILGHRTDVDDKDAMPGSKFFYWEMKGVPLRIEIGPKELKAKKLVVFRRDTGKKQSITEKSLLKFVEKTGKEISANLKAEANRVFKGLIRDANSKEDIRKIIDNKGIARCNFCSIDMKSAECAAAVEKELLATVRGIRVDKSENPFGTGNCVICGKPATKIVYIARQY
ncbi:MAG: proline--tRNA ligase [Candidatus Diapherotrites archaeon]|nr:proline--tRNA ligase [Candidatus Diapherotrites archaeon]